MRIPNLAIHLNREVNDKGFLINKETHLLPVLSTAIKAALLKVLAHFALRSIICDSIRTDRITYHRRRRPRLLPLAKISRRKFVISRCSCVSWLNSSRYCGRCRRLMHLNNDSDACPRPMVQVSEKQIRDFELSLYDTQPACTGGSSRLSYLNNRGSDVLHQVASCASSQVL